VVSVGTKAPLVHIVKALHRRVLFPAGHQLSPKSTTWLATKARHKGTRQAPLVTLMLPPLRSFSTKERGLHVPAQSVLAIPHQAGGSKMIAGETLRPQGFRCTLYNFIHSRFSSQGRHTLHSLNSKLSLALSTHTKHAQVFGWVI
jgi:hypothetical protein